MRILIVEDDNQNRAYLGKGLKENGHAIDEACTGAEGMFRALSDDYDVVIVDRMLPEVDGLSIVTAIRTAGKRTPVLILSAMGEVDDRVSGLRAGGDDYLVKPFALAEVNARLEALTRRHEEQGPPTRYAVGDLEMDLLTRVVKRDGRRIALQPREFKLLEYFMKHAEQVVTRTMLLEQVWGYHFDPQTNVIDVHVSRLRAKVDKAFDQPMIHTVRGAGYRLSAPRAPQGALN